MKGPKSRLAAGSKRSPSTPPKAVKRRVRPSDAPPEDDSHPEQPQKKRKKIQKVEGETPLQSTSPQPSPSPQPPQPPKLPEGQPGLEVHLQNCPGYFQEHHVHRAFKALGGEEAVAKVKMETRKNTGTFLRSAFVKFYTKELAQQAVSMSPVEIKGKMVQVGWPRPYLDRHSCELFLSGWPKWARDEDIYEHYAKLGASAVTEVRWVAPKGNRLSCFVRFDSEQTMQRASFAGTFTVRNAVICVERPLKAVPLEERGKVQEVARQCELFIEPCWREVDNDMLLTHYSQVGPSAVVQVRRFKNKAWVVFKTPEMAEQAAKLPRPAALEGQRVRIKLNRRDPPPTS